MPSRSVTEIKRSFIDKDTDELLDIWVKNDLTLWSSDAIEAARLVLQERNVELPRQFEHTKPNHKHTRKRKDKSRKRKSILGIILIVFGLYFFVMAVVGIVAIAQQHLLLDFRKGRTLLVYTFAIVALALIMYGVRMFRRNRKVLVDSVRELRQHQTKEALGGVLSIFGLLCSFGIIISMVVMKEELGDLSFRAVLFFLIYIISMLTLVIFGVRFALRHHKAIVTIEETATRSLSAPRYVTNSGKIQLAKNYVISLDGHSVAHPRRALRTYVKSGFVRFIIYPIFGLIGSIVSYALFLVIREVDVGGGFIQIPFSIIQLCLFLGAILALPYSLFFGGRRFFWSCIRPDLSTPEKAVKCFLFSIRVGLKERSYNLCTDQAQNLGKLGFTVLGHIGSKKSYELAISDLSSFRNWWANVRISWPPALKKMYRYDISSEECVIEIPIVAKYMDAPSEYMSFRAVFPLVCRDKLWFVAKPFIWPFVLS